MHDLIEKYRDQEHLNTNEGRRGLIALAKIARVLGYKDRQHFGQLDSSCSIGDLVNFFEDNSGAIEAVLTWVGKQRNTEWKEAMQAELHDEEEST